MHRNHPVPVRIDRTYPAGTSVATHGQAKRADLDRNPKYLEGTVPCPHYHFRALEKRGCDRRADIRCLIPADHGKALWSCAVPVDAGDASPTSKTVSFFAVRFRSPTGTSGSPSVFTRLRRNRAQVHLLAV